MLRLISHYRRHGKLKYLWTENRRAYFTCACGKEISVWLLFG